MKIILGMVIIIGCIGFYPRDISNDSVFHTCNTQPEQRNTTATEKVRTLPSRGRDNKTALTSRGRIQKPIMGESRYITSKVFTMTATAYYEQGITKSGVPAGPGKVAVDPRVIPLGTRLWIEGYGPAVAVDTGKYIKGNRFDLWFKDEAYCIEYGRRSVKVWVYK